MSRNPSHRRQDSQDAGSRLGDRAGSGQALLPAHPDVPMMAASILIPTAGVIALLGAGLVGDVGTLLAIEHVVMLPSMLVAMLLRRDEYSHAAHGHRHADHAIAA